MAESDKYLNKMLVARFGTGEFRFVGRCVAYCDVPTVNVRFTDGTTGNVRAYMCEVIEMPEEALEVLVPLGLLAGAGDKER